MNAEQLAKAVRDEAMSFEDALIEHMEATCPERLDEAHYFLFSMAISYLAADQQDMPMTLPEERKLSAAEMVEEFGLGPFVSD